MSLRNKIKEASKPHKVKLSVGDGYVAAFRGSTRRLFFDKVVEIKEKYKDEKKLVDLINSLVVTISFVDKAGKQEYLPEEYELVFEEMMATDIDIIANKSIEINGLSEKQMEDTKKK